MLGYMSRSKQGSKASNAWNELKAPEPTPLHIFRLSSSLASTIVWATTVLFFTHQCSSLAAPVSRSSRAGKPDAGCCGLQFSIYLQEASGSAGLHIYLGVLYTVIGQA